MAGVLTLLTTTALASPGLLPTVGVKSPLGAEVSEDISLAESLEGILVGIVQVK